MSDAASAVAANPAEQGPNQGENRQKYAITFTGSGFEYFKIWIVNIMLMVLTLGIYSAWAKVRNKRYFYGNTMLQGASFEYHANPIQILRGRLIAFTAVIIFSVTNHFYLSLAPVMVILSLLALPFVLWSNYRFNMRMSSYRNVHFGFAMPLSTAYKYAAVPMLIVLCPVLLLTMLPNIAIVARMIDGVLETYLISALYTLGLLIPSISICARRLHDTGRSGWWQLINLIPLVGQIVMLVFLIQDSHDHNQYGDNPKLTTA